MDNSKGGTGPFHGASHFTINQPNMIENQCINIASEEAYKVLEVLQTQISPDAMHNSRERYNAPKCHPGTREKVLKEIISWIDDPNPESCSMWLCGPAGAGKSAISQTIAEHCIKDGKLGAAFFFSRRNPARNSSQPLIATIAYQLAVYIPETKKHLVVALRENGPAIFNMTLEWQMLKLVVDPFAKVYSESPSAGPKCVIIDGLDECQERMQAEIVRCVVKAASYKSATQTGAPLSFLLVSRPELEIRQAFTREKSGFKILNLDEKYNPEKDIEWFLRDKFNQIRTEHPGCHNMDSNWPSNEQIKHIVQHSSGKFIYAAGVIRFVENPRADPEKSLNEIIEYITSNLYIFLRGVGHGFSAMHGHLIR